MKTIKEHYVYKIINVKTNQYYIGVRSTKNIIQDNYMGSSSVWTKDYVKQNKKDLIKLIIQTYPTRKLANKGELELLKIVKGDPKCVNVLYEKIPTSFGKKQTLEHILKRIKKGKDHGMFGKHHTTNLKKKISLNSPFKGKKRPQLFADNMSKLQKGKIVSEQTKQKSSKTKKERYAKGITKSATRSILVEDLFLGIKKNYNSLKTFCDQENLNYGSLKVFARKQYIYKERYRVIYTSPFKVK